VPVPFFHGVPESPPEKGDRHRRPPEVALKNRTPTEPVPIFGLRAEENRPLEIDKSLLLVLKSPGMGEGPPDLGEELLKAFLTTLLESGTVPARIICLNSAIFLTTEGSPVIEIMNRFAGQGTEILSCATCLNYFDRQNRLVVGRSTNMKETVQAMLDFEKVLSP